MKGIKNTVLDFSQATVKGLEACFVNLLQYLYAMAQCNTVNVKLLASYLNKLKSATKNTTDMTLELSSDMFGDDKTSFLHKFLLTNRQATSYHMAFVHTLPANIKLSKTELCKIIQSGRFLLDH